MLSYLLEGLTAQSIFERMISLKKKTLKMIASTVMLAFGMTVVPLPALAVSSNIVAETKDKNTGLPSLQFAGFICFREDYVNL